MLARQKRRRHHHRDLFAGERGNEGRAERDLGLAEADIAADQPIHRPPGGEVSGHRLDRGVLIVGFLVGEARAELVVEALGDGKFRRFAEFPRGGNAHKLRRHLVDAGLEACLARLPAEAAEAVEFGRCFLVAVTREQFEIFDREEQTVAALIVDLQAIVRRAERLDRLQPGEAADAVVDMDDEIAGGEARELRNEVVGAARAAARARKPIAENVLFGNDRGVGALKAGLKAKNREAEGALGQRPHLVKTRDGTQIGKPVVEQHVLHALARALAPEGENHAFVRGFQRARVGHDRVEEIAVFVGALGGEGAPSFAAGVDHVARLGHREGREANERGICKPRFPFFHREVKPLRRQRLVERALPRLHRLVPRGVIIGDLLEPLASGLFDQRLQYDRRTRQIIEQGFEPLQEERQPVFEARIAPALAHGLEKRVALGLSTELGDIAHAKALDRFPAQLHFAGGDELQFFDAARGALRLGIEGADRFHRVAEEIEPHGSACPRRVEIENAAAHGIFADVADGGSANKSVGLQPARDFVHWPRVTRGNRERLGGDCFPRRHALQKRVDGGEYDAGILVRMNKFCQRRHAAGRNRGVRRYPIIGQAIPGRERQHR